jgi:hypothetical protein
VSGAGRAVTSDKREIRDCRLEIGNSKFETEKRDWKFEVKESKPEDGKSKIETGN